VAAAVTSTIVIAIAMISSRSEKPLFDDFFFNELILSSLVRKYR